MIHILLIIYLLVKYGSADSCYCQTTEAACTALNYCTYSSDTGCNRNAGPDDCFTSYTEKNTCNA